MEAIDQGAATTSQVGDNVVMESGVPYVDVFVTSECIHLYILCIVTLCLFQDVSIM